MQHGTCFHEAMSLHIFVMSAGRIANCKARGNRITSPNFKAINMRFYDVDGIEMDIQDLKFFIDEKRYTEIKESIEELLGEFPNDD